MNSKRSSEQQEIQRNVSYASIYSCCEGSCLSPVQSEVADLAKREEKLAELQKQQVRETLKGEVAQGIQQLAFLTDSINALAT